MNLIQRKCVPCEAGVMPFGEAEIKKYISSLKERWEVMDGKKISCDFKFKDFKDAMKFVNAVAALAESERHHPDMHIFYNKVNIELWTHAIGGLSENDFILASKIELI
ncbi:MAG: 4a-hydroxytetrahydrobiopterin dehydratase [Candidatus Colwellbacteria bacterium]|nr:4a-hydroxytetrahydrobiopterin dehydratase [Candidatus Colwellbacteria bacterium]MBI3274209.1 4a-hydroxytetrahydrobiopterin dehydratase [Candidatus Colwellbacteria bacterium]